MSNNEIDRNAVKVSTSQVKEDLNADPITGESGSHPVGTGLGTASGAAAGAAIGSVAGPLGTLVGDAIGAVAGHNAAEAVNPTEEDSYWREHSATTAYFGKTRELYADINYDRDYQNAYRIGYENRHHYPIDANFQDAERDLRQKWEFVKGDSRLTWEQAKLAIQDAWEKANKQR